MKILMELLYMIVKELINYDEAGAWWAAYNRD